MLMEYYECKKIDENIKISYQYNTVICTEIRGNTNGRYTTSIKKVLLKGWKKI